MFVVVSGTNRPGSSSLKVARKVEALLAASGQEVRVLDLQELPADLFRGESYHEKPEGFAPFQEAIHACEGIVSVVPEYNGSFPGVLKYFIDMLEFPSSLSGKPCAFVGLAAGRWGGLRPVEQLEAVFLYRHAQPFARRVLLPGVLDALDAEGDVVDPDLERRLGDLVQGFVAFARRVSG